MLYKGLIDEALVIHQRAVDKYNTTFSDVQYNCIQLYVLRQLSVRKIEEVETLINTIANTPKEFERKTSQINKERINFRGKEDFAKKTYEAAVKAGAGVAAGVAGGAAIASMAPTAAMWVATTFGTASTGTAISTLSGAVATKAALAWLGGGALAAGGAGVAGGQALLALAGPIGWGISAVSAAGSLAIHAGKNKKISNEIIEEAKKITVAGAQLKEAIAVVSQLYDKTMLLLDNLMTQLSDSSKMKDCDYSALVSDDQLRLGTLVNNTLSLAELLNKTVE